MEGLFTAWGRILAGRVPNLSVEITRECPLTCPGCYAFTDWTTTERAMTSAVTRHL